MLYSLQGTLEWQGVGFAIINVGGVGFWVYIPFPTLSSLGEKGSQVKLYTYLYVKEDSLTLYGFSSAEELELFQALIGVSGVGPKVALALLSAFPPQQLISAITSGDVDSLSQVPKVGRKVASRLVLELKGKLKEAELGVSGRNAEVLAAMRSLGYTAAEATSALSSIPDDEGLSLEDRLRLVLRYLAKT
jgi:Holliday junction DNA helicase RuvA